MDVDLLRQLPTPSRPAASLASSRSKPTDDPDAALRQKAEQLVSQTFFGTLLRQMRESPWKDEMFSGGRAGQAYQQMFDQHLVEKLGRGAGKRLVDSLVKSMSRQQTATPDRIAPRQVAAAYQQTETPAHEPVARTA